MMLSASAGDLLSMPRGIPHGIYNNCGAEVQCFFWVTPTGQLVDLFRKLHNMARPDEVAQVSTITRLISCLRCGRLISYKKRIFLCQGQRRSGARDKGLPDRCLSLSFNTSIALPVYLNNRPILAQTAAGQLSLERICKIRVQMFSYRAAIITNGKRDGGAFMLFLAANSQAFKLSRRCTSPGSAS